MPDRILFTRKISFNLGRSLSLLLVIALLISLSPGMAKAIEYEGYVIGPAGVPLNGNFDITFVLYEGRDSTIVWVEKQRDVKVNDGGFRVELGSQTPFKSADIRWEKLHFLGIQAGNYDEQVPRKIFRRSQAASTSASISASTSPKVRTVVNAVPDTSGSISITSSSVPTQGLKRHTDNHNNPHQVTAEQIGAATRKDTDSHALNSSAHHQKTTSFSELEDKIGSGQIAENSITGNQIRNASIRTEDIANRAITAKKIKGGAGSGLDADLIDGMQANEIIAAAQDEVRTPISRLPFTISKSGSYFLTANLKSSQQHGITVKGNNVTIDLMGFSIIGDGSKVNGITLDGTHNITVQNGTIRDFGAAGIFTLSGDSHRIIQVRAINNGSGGIVAFSSGTLISECTAWGNRSDGIVTGANSIIRNSISHANHGNGISADSGSTIIGNSVFDNRGKYGISATGSTIKSNTVHGNANTGLFARGSTLIGNTISNNAGWGIQALDGSTVTASTVSMNNKANAPEKGGISVGDDCQIKGNTVTSNKQNNIHISGSDNMIEENLVTDSLGGNGINFAHPTNGPQNFYANNRASGNGKDYAGNLPVGSADGGGNASF